MNPRLLITGAVLALISGSAMAQYSIDWPKIAGGGVLNSTCGVFTLSGTIGQHDAGGPMSGGQFNLTGGFWALPVAVQTEGAPTLTIAPATSGFIFISWTPSTTGFVLQEKTDLNAVLWTNSVSGGTNGVIIPLGSATKFYRLNRP